MIKPGRISFTRRDVLQATAFATLATALAELAVPLPASAQPSPAALKRANVRSAEGKAMLKLYAEGVAKMKALPSHNPRSWIFQANIHDYPRDTEPSKVFDPKLAKTPAEKAAMAAHKELALGKPGQSGIWGTCSHHGLYQDHFVTWHRIYLYHFEAIIASLVGKPFALPYWAYEKEGGRRALPAAFLSPAKKSNPLWFPNRKITASNGGIETDEEASHQEAFSKTTLLDGDDGGFSRSLDGTPHGQVHVAIGREDGMGDTVFAGRDPIFWLHHANIDRLWQSWRRVSNARPVEGTFVKDPINDTNWKKRAKFPFADTQGKRSEMAVLDALNWEKKFNISYDKYEPAPSADVALGFGENAEVKVADATTLSRSDAPATAQITKKGKPVVVKLKPAVAPDVALGFGERVETRYRLVVDVETTAVTTAAHAVYLNVRESAGSDKTSRQRVATFNMFGKGHAAHGAGEAHGPITATWTTDITKLVRDKLIDPLNPGDLTFEARYNDPEAAIKIKDWRIVAE